jgi:NO-binding membrane sensor protein with MHYT domain
MTAELLPVTYAPLLVALSFLVSAVGAYTALLAAGAARTNGQPVNRINILLAGVALGGIGIWSMHFIGMVAWQVDLGVGYRLLETMVSLVAAVIVSSLALGYVASGPVSPRRLLVAGPLAGIGVAVMHYLGMYSMRFNGFFDWNASVVALSVLIAMTAATAALWLAFNARQRSHRVAAALVMATAVCTMHYTGMAAASVICTTANRAAMLPGLLRPADLPPMVMIIALGVAGIIAVDLLIQRVNGRGVATNASNPMSGLHRASLNRATRG